MQKYGKKYGFVVTLQELKETIPTLWQTVLDYARSRHINLDRVGRLFPYFRDENTGDYNLCHFWSNFEIASLDLWRSPSYRDFFDYLDKTGNFFYERWGDAPGNALEKRLNGEEGKRWKERERENAYFNANHVFLSSALACGWFIPGYR